MKNKDTRQNKDTKKEIVPLDADQLDKVTGGSNNSYGYNFCPYCGFDVRTQNEENAEAHLVICKMLHEYAQKEAQKEEGN